LDAVPRVPAPTAWSHSVIVTLLADSDTGTLEFEQEMVEILAMEGDGAGRGSPCGSRLGPRRVP
jgi:hypothetical protein